MEKIRPERKPNHRKVLLVLSTLMIFMISYLCLSNGVFIIYQNLFYIPIVYSCFRYARSGLIFSSFISMFHYVLFSIFHPEPLWDEIVRLGVFLAIGLITYRLSEGIKRERLTVEHLNQCLIKDLNARAQLEEHLEQEKERLRITITSIGDGVISTDQRGRITILNQVAERMTGWKQADALGLPIEKVFRIVNEETGDICENPVHKVLELGVTQGLANHTALISQDGTVRSIADSAAPIKNKSGDIQGVIIVFRDVTDEKKRQDEIYFKSFYDALTGMHNRRYFEEEFKRLDVARNLPISIIMGDLNGLKLVNDTFGHARGDKLLMKASSALKTACRCGDIAARWGGDEFVMLLPKTTKAEVEDIVKKILRSCSKMKVGSLNVSVSLGWGTKTEKDESLSKVLKSAEDFMYKHKLAESGSMRGNIIHAIFRTLREKNPRIESHSERVSLLCEQIGTAMNLSAKDINELKVSGLLHDIGKVTIDDRILQKTEKLTEYEWLEIKRHSDIGYRILNTSPDMSDIAVNVLSHHERPDGKGYPRGICGEEIPLASKIIAVADSYDAMTNERPYNKIQNKDEAIEELIKNKETQFDSIIVDLFIEKVLRGRERIKCPSENSP
ncbi:diguanylate cyclase [Anoxybacterium hadale]|uniref:Diguanylate cyclase n=1 Tax=Anoxybacterium hadale TaxID=3408580 RepID=A0ACD1AHP0_9FIRM|nr:diguanylate cyclase [Clostridiales bacterium]